MEQVCDYFLLFMIYSMIGWICETICCSFCQKKLVLNRGFLIGPYCPIYGCGALFLIFLLKKYTGDSLVLFVMSALGASILEYLTSYIMEKLFKARWWDYSNKSFNINGRICLQNSILFGMLGLVIMYIINPFFIKWLQNLSLFCLLLISIILLIIFLTDIIISFLIMFQIRSDTILLLQDSTEFISKQVRDILSKNRLLKARLLNAFPHARILNHKTLLRKVQEQLKRK